MKSLIDSLNEAFNIIEEVVKNIDGIDYRPGYSCTLESSTLRQAQKCIVDVIYKKERDARGWM
jgi:hypothetical protein